MASRQSSNSNTGCIGGLFNLFGFFIAVPFYLIFVIAKAIAKIIVNAIVKSSLSKVKRHNNIPDTFPENVETHEIPKAIQNQKPTTTKPKQMRYDVQEELKRIDHMEGHRFEYWCADLLRDNDFINVSVTRGSGDDGGDIIAYKDGKKYLFQCKRYSSNVGNQAVKDAFYGRQMYHANFAIVMTNRHFTDNAFRGAKETGVWLWGRKKIIELLEGRRWYMYENMKLWPHNRGTNKINYEYFASLPAVGKYDGMKEYVKCFPLGGETEQYNPYEEWEESGKDYSNFLLVEFYTEDFESEEEAKHFFKAIEKRYYAIMPRGIHGTNRFNFVAYVHGDLIRDKFDTTKYCWNLENWS